MFLAQLLLIFLVAILAFYGALWRYAAERIAMDRDRLTVSMTATITAVLVAVAIATRDPAFGVDTSTYMNLFAGFCAGDRVLGYDPGFQVSFAALNVAMLGACNPTLLPVAWVCVMYLLLLLTRGSVRSRVTIVALLLVSLVGFELATNAMRQSFSAAAMVAAVSWLPRRRLLSLSLFLLAIAFHSAALLAIAALALAILPWRWFLLLLGSGVGVIAAALQGVLQVGAAEPAVALLSIYLKLADDEIYVRLLAMVTLVATVAAPLIMSTTRAGRRAVLSSRLYQRALKLTVTCLPPLILPWFGYRFIYSLYPVILFVVIRAIEEIGTGPERTDVRLPMSAAILIFNLALLFVWSVESALIRLTPVYA